MKAHSPEGEFAAVERLRRATSGLFGVPGPGETWIGDDAAVLASGRGHLLLTIDATVAGVHADLELMGLDDLGWRGLVAAVSDIAAMGGSPQACVVSVSGPSSTDLDLLYEGIGAAAAEHRCPVVGGDLSSSSTLAISVAVLGRVEDGPAPVLRSGARPGESIWVTGPLGASAAGLRMLRELFVHEGTAGNSAGPTAPGTLVGAHLRPHARVEEGTRARISGSSAMIDVSDGFAADLSHLADASAVGFELVDVPVAEGARLEEALGGGEDYELVFCAPDSVSIVEDFESAGLAAPLKLGIFTDDPSRRTLDGEPLQPLGFEHRWR